MRKIERSSQFKTDYKRARARYPKDLDTLLVAILTSLAMNVELPAKNRDHVLTGNWRGYRECHIKPDLLLIYSYPDDTTLRLARLGSHSNLFS